MTRFPFIAALPLLLPAAAAAAPLGQDAAACEANKPAVLATVTGLKDRRGLVKLELYPATEADFTRDDKLLIAENKTFRRIAVATPASGPLAMCIRVPAPGRYALIFIHSRTGVPKFNYKVDGAGFASNRRIGYSKPKVDAAIVDVGAGTLPVSIKAQYFSLFGGFSPSNRD